MWYRTVQYSTRCHNVYTVFGRCHVPYLEGPNSRKVCEGTRIPVYKYIYNFIIRPRTPTSLARTSQRGVAASHRCAFMSLMPAHALHANAAAWTKYPSIAMDGMDCVHRHMHRIACLPSQPASVPEALDMITCTQHFAIVTLACSHRPNQIASRPMLAAGRTFALRSVTASI